MGCLKHVLAGLAMVAWIGGCSSKDADKPQDAGAETSTVTDGSVVDLPPNVQLYDCDSPGWPCNAHDPCAIEPICDDDLKCRPRRYQDCDDGLPCTDDICLGQGKCSHEAKKDTCALPVRKDEGTGTEIRCFAAEERNPKDMCKLCDPDEDQYSWTPANGGTCDDGDPCTKDDYCAAGVCKGTPYGDQCQDQFSCTEDLCDGQGGCLGNPLKADACLINGQCYTEGEKDADGCNICDPKKSQNSWTSLTEHCLIDGKCYQPGENDTTGCSVCDPDKNPNGWTPLPGMCKIANQCFKKGDTNTSEGGCGECDPVANPTGWTVKGSDCYIDKKCYKPGDTDTTGCGECDPAKDKYKWSTVENTCLIDGKCFQPGQTDTTGCGECDPAAHDAGWTVKGNHCLISGVCYDPGETDATGCGACVPATSKSSFTPLPNKCLIGQKCYDDQGLDDTGCLKCVFASNPGAWSAAGQTKVTGYDFEGGVAPNWTISNTLVGVGWVVSNRRPAAGSYSLYYGDPAKGDYDGGAKNSGTATTPEITLGPGAKAGLRFWIWAEVEDGVNYDKIEVDIIEGSTPTTIWQKNVTDKIEKKVWKEIKIDLSSFAGKTVKFAFRMDTVDSVSNKTEGVYIDDVTVYSDCQ